MSLPAATGGRAGGVAPPGFLAPIAERRARYAAGPGLVPGLIAAGTERTRREVRRTVADMRDAMGSGPATIIS